MKSNKPKVSFMEDSLFWESSILYNVVDRVKSYSLSRSVETEEKSGYKYIHYGDIHTGVAQIVSKSSILPSINLGNYEFLEKGDLILADASEDYQGIAKPAVIIDTLPYKLVAGLHTIALRPNNLDSLFLYYTFYSRDFRRHGYRTGTGMKVFGISTSNLLKYELKYPSKEVQSQIGRFFKNLEDTISLHQQELEALKQTKQGFLQKMFPKNNDTVPEIRFPGFQDAWNEYKLGDLMKVTSVKRIHQSDWTDSGVRFLRARDIVSTFNRKRTDDYLYISKEKYQQYSLISGKVAKNDVLVTGVGSIGVPMLITDDNPVYFKDGNIIWFKNEDKINGYFLYYSFVGSRIQKFIKNIAGIGTVGTYTIDSGKKTPILLPSKEEQIKIGEFFRQLDEVIELKEKELDALKETKKGFLQKMFV